MKPRHWLIASLVLCCMLALFRASGVLATERVAQGASGDRRGSAQVAQLLPLEVARVPQLLKTKHGEPLIIEIWMLDCTYCRENVARIVQWQHTHRGVRMAMVAMDRFDDNAEAVSQALALMPVTPQIAQYANAEAIPERLRAALDPGWRGETPRTLFIDGKGRLSASSGLLAPGVLDAWLHTP
jgi:hypothetical protein